VEILAVAELPVPEYGWNSWQSLGYQFLQKNNDTPWETSQKQRQKKSAFCYEITREETRHARKTPERVSRDVVHQAGLDGDKSKRESE
jgi:hypothetical protein